MPRPTRRRKPYIVVFCEGESEQAYTDFLKKEFKVLRPSNGQALPDFLRKQTGNSKRTKPTETMPKSQTRFGFSSM